MGCAHIGDKTSTVYYGGADGFNPIWQEQISFETWQMLKNTKGVVEGSATNLDEIDEQFSLALDDRLLSEE